MIKRTLLLAIFMASNTLLAQFNFNVSPIDESVKSRMLKGGSWRKECPVALKDLRYLHLNHWNFEGETVSGELIVHKDIAWDTVYVFEELYLANYAINQMHLVSDYNANDWASIEADNTSAFNCRLTTGKKTWSKHSYGRAIDINPIENPYISRRGHISHKASEAYRNRVHHDLNNLADRALLLSSDSATKIFKNHGFKWGGDWKTKDYQHFVK
jgi:hypothetical protein